MCVCVCVLWRWRSEFQQSCHRESDLWCRHNGLLTVLTKTVLIRDHWSSHTHISWRSARLNCNLMCNLPLLTFHNIICLTWSWFPLDSHSLFYDQYDESPSIFITKGSSGNHKPRRLLLYVILEALLHIADQNCLHVAIHQFKNQSIIQWVKELVSHQTFSQLGSASQSSSQWVIFLCDSLLHFSVDLRHSLLAESHVVSHVPSLQSASSAAEL